MLTSGEMWHGSSGSLGQRQPLWLCVEGPATWAVTLSRTGPPVGSQKRGWPQAELQLQQRIRRVPSWVLSIHEEELSRVVSLSESEWVRRYQSYHSFNFSMVLNNCKIVRGREKWWGGRERQGAEKADSRALWEPRTPLAPGRGRRAGPAERKLTEKDRRFLSLRHSLHSILPAHPPAFPDVSAPKGPNRIELWGRCWCFLQATLFQKFGLQKISYQTFSTDKTVYKYSPNRFSSQTSSWRKLEGLWAQTAAYLNIIL